jgi:hypothetical protein
MKNKEYIETIKEIINNDKNTDSFVYHLEKISFDFFITIHFNRVNLYNNSQDAHCARRKILRETCGNIAKRLRIPNRSLNYFGVCEPDSEGKMHLHLLLIKRKDLNHLPKDIVISAITEEISTDEFRANEATLDRRIEPVKNSQRAVNYIFKLKTDSEKSSSFKEWYYHSKYFFDDLPRIIENSW